MKFPLSALIALRHASDQSGCPRDRRQPDQIRPYEATRTPEILQDLALSKEVEAELKGGDFDFRMSKAATFQSNTQ